MKCVRVNLTKIEVEKFSLRDGAHLRVFFDDGGNKCLEYSTQLDNVNDDIQNIIMKIHVYEKSQNQVLDAEDILDSFVSVLVEDEDAVKDKMRNFLGRLRDDKSRLRNYGSHNGYIDSLNQMQKKSLELKNRDRSRNIA